MSREPIKQHDGANERLDPAKTTLRAALVLYWENVAPRKRNPRQERYWIDRWLQQPQCELTLDDLTDPAKKHFSKFIDNRHEAGYSEETIRQEIALIAKILEWGMPKHELFPRLQNALARPAKSNKEEDAKATILLINHIRKTSGLSAPEISRRLEKYYIHDESNVLGRLAEGKFTRPPNSCDRLFPSQRWHLVQCSLEEGLLEEKDLACPPNQDPLLLWNRVIAKGAKPSDYWKTPGSTDSQEWELWEEHEYHAETRGFENARNKAEASMDFILQTIRQFANPELSCDFAHHELKSHEVAHDTDNFHGMSELLNEIEAAWHRISNLLQSFYWIKTTSGLPTSAFEIQRAADKYMIAVDAAMEHGCPLPPVPDDVVLEQYNNQEERFRSLKEAMRYQWMLTGTDPPQLPARDVLDKLWVIWSNRDASLGELVYLQRGEDFPTPWHHNCLQALEAAVKAPEKWPKIWAELRAPKERPRSPV